ncbi:MAG: restriction endonuclease, partial [Thaumarchaeota archaeon]|nr:restriction endonuclease [Nitrososphaerota archaeon]
MSSYERGLALEELVAKIFRAKGYDVKHNIKLMGRSGVEHQIDVYAEYKAPLHTSRIVVECKSYDKPIDKD